ncbi:hypothetical protein [Horticoccus sp. 23ND18S-11]|uniref:hypothetical protein n=1 Tax=Horticoccus sp. 23ND18S-11 TaxID=3391832 RepID=UPI0039C9D9D3
MKTNTSFSRGLRVAAIAVLLGGVGVWAASGARVGWTQTSAVTMQRDDITGIDFPVRHATFDPGIEVPLIGAALAAVLAGVSFIPRRAPQAA